MRCGTAQSGAGAIPVLLMARLERPRRAGHPLEADDLGIAAELVYTANSLILLDRTEPDQVQVFVEKVSSTGFCGE